MKITDIAKKLDLSVSTVNTIMSHHKQDPLYLMKLKHSQESFGKLTKEIEPHIYDYVQGQNTPFDASDLAIYIKV